MVKIQDHYAPANFMVLDMEEEDDSPIILGRLFLNTTNAVIYIRSRQIHLQFLGEKVRYYFNSYTTFEQPKKTCSRRRRRRSSYRQEDQLPRNGWEDYEGEVEKDLCQPRLNKWDDEEPEAPTKEEATPPTSKLTETILHSAKGMPQI
jgi:hypothetical protein